MSLPLLSPKSEDSRGPSPAFSFSKALDLAHRKSIESIEAKYNELRNRNQKLLEHLQSREKEFQREYESLKFKLEANKNVIRELEDKNLDLKYQLIASKKKETDQANEITKLKALLKKYTHNKENEDGVAIQHSKSLRMSTLGFMMGGDSSTANSDSTSMQLSGPDLCESLRSSFRKTITGPLHVDSHNEPDIQQHQEKRRHSRMASSHVIRSLDCLDIEEGGDFGRRYNLKINCDPRSIHPSHRDNIVEDMEEVISEESISSDVPEKRTPFKLPHFKQGEQLDLFSPSKRRGSLLGLQLERVKSKASGTLVPENPEYLDKFNMLSQNIVSLGVKAEISIIETPKDLIKSPLNTVEGESPDCCKKSSFLKYRNINRRLSTLVLSPTTALSRLTSSPMIQKPGRLFEDFFVIGANKEDLVSFTQQNPEKAKGVISPKILFSYPSPVSSLNQPPYNSIPDFAFPFGVDIRRIKSTASFGGLNPIIYTSSDIEQRGKCFVFPLLSVNLEEEGPALTLGEVVDSSNPDYLYYIACISFKDFITMTDSKEQNKTLDKIEYWEVNKVMCFMSYYPFTSLFFDILIKILNILKVERMIKMAELNEKDLARHEAVDSRFTSNFFETIVRKNLKILLESPVPEFTSTFKFKLQGSFAETPIEFQLPNRALAHTLEASWACTTVFRYMSYKDLLWFFTAVLLERKLVFLSSNTHLLTATLFVLRSLIKPLKYPFPLIFNLPEVLMVYCDAPGAALIGINRGEDYLKQQGLFQEYPSCIFVCLDEQKLYLNNENKVQAVQFSNFEKSLITHYVKLNANLKTDFIEAKKTNQSSQRTEPKLTEQAEEREKSLKVLDMFKEAIEKKILSNVPSKPIYKPDRNFDYDEIGKIVVSKAKEVDKKFLKEFVKTQIFAYYLEQRYEALGLQL